MLLPPDYFTSLDHAGAWIAAGVLALVILTWSERVLVRRTGLTNVAPLVWLASSLVSVFIPLAALERGAISPYYFGVYEIDWPASLTAGAFPALALILSATAGWLAYRHQAGPGVRGPRELLAPLDALLREWCLAFLRAAGIGLIAGWGGAFSPVARQLAGQPLYWGSWLGLVGAAVAALLIASGGRERVAGERERWALGAMMAVGTTALFVLSRNLWLCLACRAITFGLTALAFPPAPIYAAEKKERESHSRP